MTVRPKRAGTRSFPRPIPDANLRQNLQWLLSLVEVEETSGDAVTVLSVTLPISSHNYEIDLAIGVMRVITQASGSLLTGVAGGYSGRLLRIVNTGPGILTVPNDSSSSTAANRVLSFTGEDIIVAPGGELSLLYDAGTLRWRQVSTALQAKVVDLGAVSGAVDIDFRFAPIYQVELAGNLTPTFSGYEAGKSYFLVIVQGAASYTVDFGSQAKWPLGLDFQVSSEAGAIDIITLLGLNVGGLSLFAVGQAGFA